MWYLCWRLVINSKWLIRGILFISLVLHSNVYSKLSIISPKPNSWLYTTEVQVSGSVDRGSYVLLNGKRVPLSFNKKFQATIKGVIGENLVHVHLLDAMDKIIDSYSMSVWCLRDFSDIQSHWAARDIRLLSTFSFGLARLERHLFLPDTFLTRAEMAVSLVKLLDLPINAEQVPRFQDVLPEHWAYPYIETLSEAFPILLLGDKRFSPNGYVTRLDLLRTLAHIYNVPIKPVTFSEIPDLPPVLLFLKILYQRLFL